MATTKRYWSWELTGAGSVVGVVPIPDDQQPDEYTELDSEKDAVVGVREHYEGYGEPLVRRFTLDAKRRLQQSDYSDPTTGLTGRNQYEYDTRGFLCARRELDPKGAQRFRFVVQCDSAGRIAEETLFDHANQQTERHVYAYDARGRQVLDTKYQGKSTTPEVLFKRTWDDAGRVLSNGQYAPDGAPQTVFHYTWDEKNRRTEIALRNGEQLSFVARSSFDERGRRVSVEHLDGDLQPFARSTTLRNGQRELWVAPTPALGPKARQLLDGAPLREQVQLPAEQVNALSMLAWSKLERGHFDQARSLYETLAALDSREPSFPAGVAVAWLSAGEPEQALVWFDRALGRAPRHVQSLVGKGELLLQSGRIREGLELFRAAFTAATPADEAVIRRAQLIAASIANANK